MRMVSADLYNIFVLKFFGLELFCMIIQKFDACCICIPVLMEDS